MKRFIFLLISFFCLSMTYSQNYSMEKLKKYAFANLRDRIEDSTFWNKVHAIEFIIDLGENKIAKCLLENNLRKFETEPQKRIGYWRCMALNENNEKAKYKYIKKILDVYLNTNSSDIIHAAESLAKLSISLVPYSDSKTMEGEYNNLLEAYYNWTSIYTVDNGSLISYDRLYEFLSSENIEQREIIAYGTKYLGKVDSCNWNYLADLALNESMESLVGVYLLCGVYTTCPDSERNNHKTKVIGNRIKEIILDGNLKNKFEAFVALGSFSNPCDADFIKNKMLEFNSNKNKTNNGHNEKDLDLLSAISYAFLKTTNNNNKQ